MLPHPHHAALVLLGWVCVVLCALRYQNKRQLLVELLLESVKWKSCACSITKPPETQVIFSCLAKTAGVLIHEIKEK